LATATVGSIALIPGLAQADPTPSINDVKAKVDQLHAEAEQATEAYDAASAQLSDLQHKVDQIQSRITVEQGDLTNAQASLGSLASAQYKSGGVDSTLQLMLEYSPDTFLQQASAMNQITNHTADAVRSSQEVERQLKQDKTSATDQLAQLQKTRDLMAKAKAEADAKQKAAQDLLNSLTAPQRQQYNQIEAKSNNVASTTLANLPVVPMDTRAGIAVAFAKAQIGKPYISGAAGPNAYDCSGLTMAAWGKAGVKMAHGSSEQYYEFPKVALKDIQPGDMIIYYSTMHHVGIYVGNNTIVHAPHSGTTVQYAPMNSMPIAGIVRP
jgi:cell wall-associated NlpC family hydrolase